MTVIAFAAARRRVPLAAGACLLSFTAFWLAQRAADVSMIDLMVYRAEGETVRAGGDLYALRTTEAHLPTTYPPFAALLFTPLTLLDTPDMRMLATLGNLVLLVAFVALSLRLILEERLILKERFALEERHARVEAVLWVSALAVWCEPVWTTLRYGQINLLLAVLVLWDLSRRPGHRWAGLGIGLAAAVKLTPALFAVFLLLTGAAEALRRGVWRPAVRHACVAAVSFAGATLLAAAVLPYDSRRFWTRMVFEAGRVGLAEDTANQSLRGVLARLLHSADPGPWWAMSAAVSCALGLAAAVAAALRGERARAVLCCAATALLVSPVSWSHHWVWCVPMVLALGVEAARRGGPLRWAAAGAACLVFCSYALWWVPHGAGRLELAQNYGQMTLSGLYVLTASAFLLAALVPVGRSQAVAKE
ncbi:MULTISPECIES: glycosyltransferase 87 family protein [Streptomyces]|uniref:glycosyltransferase 87 family protein n=1 Tax=Streptomyces TaxID=1883 RepID=UPI001E2F95C7|nr:MULTISPECIES: glycosyltransferase 87 family protein [Streptomyces]UFQ15605.1 glycosyltransferase 87 family protein [Streptomyces huasconensis]WCL85208.1 glycosyltransferase 87 family protein [Streptomyces sp. JCM 35825]